VGPCHHGGVCPQVVDGGTASSYERVAVNMLNKQSQTALGFGEVLTTPHCKNLTIL
jgi:hypothetical protein